MKNIDENRSDDFEILLLRNQLCFALYVATRSITKTYKEKLSDIGLTYPQYLVMITLWEESPLTVSDLARRLVLDSGTATPLLQRLEKSGLIKRQRSEDDERTVMISLTEKGMTLRDDVIDARKHVACRLGMSQEEIMKLRSDITDVITRLGVDLDEDLI